MKRIVWFGILLCATLPLYAQSAYYADTATTTTQVNGAPVTTPASHAYLTVCAVSNPSTSSGKGAQCNPATIYWDQALTQPVAQPFRADEFGKFGFWAAPAVYRYQICLPTGCRSYTLPTSGSGSGGGGTLDGVSVATANGFTGAVSGAINSLITLDTDPNHMLPVTTGSAATYLNGAGTYTTPPGTGATFPTTPSIVVNTSTTASRNASTTDVSALLQTATGCSTAGYVYSPSTNTCIVGGGTLDGVSVATANGFTGTVSGTVTPLVTLNTDSNHVLPVTTGSATTYLNGAGTYTTPPGTGATFPSTPSIVVNTSTTASRNAGTTDVAALLQTASGCSTAGNVYSPSTNTCIGGGATNGFPFTLGGTTITATSSTTSLAGLTSLQGMYQASPYSAAQGGLGSGYILNNLCGGSPCAISRDPADPVTDSVGQVEPNNMWANTYTPPAGSVIISTNGGGFGVQSYNGQGRRFLDMMSSGMSQVESYNNAGYGAVDDIRYEDLNAGINGQGSISVPSYSPQYRSETAIAFGEGTHTFDNINEISAGTSDSNFDERNYYCRPGNPQGSSEDCRFWQYSYWEAGAPDGNVTVGGSTTVNGLKQGATQVSFAAATNQNMLAVGHQLIDMTAGVVDSADTGVVNTSGTMVTWVSGVNFANIQTGQYVLISGVQYEVTAVASATSLTIGSSAGTQSSVAYTYTIPTGTIGSLALNTAVVASTGMGTLVSPVLVYPTSTDPLEVPSEAVDIAITATSGTFATGDLISLPNTCCFLENVRLNSVSLGGTAWNSTTAYVKGNIRSLSGNVYESKTSNTNSSPANSLTESVALSLLQNTGSGTLNITLASANNVVAGAPIYVNGATGSCAVLNGTYTVQSVSGSSAVLSGASGSYANCGYQGTVSGDWNLLGSASTIYVANANVRYPHYPGGGSVCANGMVGYGMEVTDQTHTNASTGQGDMRYVQYVTCSPTTTSIQVAGIENGNLANFGGFGVSSIILYPAADVQGILQKPTQANPAIVALSDNVGFPVGDTVEEAAQIYGKFNGQKEAYAFWNPNAQYNLHQVLLGGYSQTGTWWDVAGTGPSLGALNPFSFNLPVSDFADFSSFPSKLFNICSGGGCSGSTSLFSAGGLNVLNFAATGQVLTVGADLNVAGGLSYTAQDTAGTHTATFVDPFSSLGPAVTIQNTSTYPVSPLLLASLTGGVGGSSSAAFAPALTFFNGSVSTQATPWAIGQGDQYLNGDFVLGYNPQFSGATPTFTAAEECTTAGVCNFPNGLQEAGSAVCTAENGLCGGSGSGNYNPAAVAITGGAINGAAIGGGTPAAGAFTVGNFASAGAAGLAATLTATSTTTGTGNPILGLCPNGTAGNPCLLGVGSSFAANSIGMLAWQPGTTGFFQMQTYNNGSPIQLGGSGINTTSPLMVNNGAAVNTLGPLPAAGISLAVNPTSSFTVDTSGNVVGANGTFNGTVKAAQYLGPATAPSGSCSTNGAWEFSQDGHATFCSAGTWVTKI